MPVATHEEIANHLREHYDWVCQYAGSCFPTIGQAINAWEREPELLERIEELERELDAQRNAARQMLKDVQAIDKLRAKPLTERKRREDAEESMAQFFAKALNLDMTTERDADFCSEIHNMLWAMNDHLTVRRAMETRKE